MPINGVQASAGKKPATPTIGTATDGGTGTTVSVAFTPSSYIGKGTITYTATSNPGSITGTGSGSPITVSSLTAGTAYTFTVKGDTNYGVASDTSSASNSVTPAVPTSFDSIATATGNGTATSVTFSSIPSTYKSLQIRYAIITATNNAEDLYLRINGDTASNYAWHKLRGNGTTASATASAPDNTLSLHAGLNGLGQTYLFTGVVDIIDYASTSKFKTVRTLTGIDKNGSGDIALTSGLWRSTSAITSLNFYVQGASSFFSTGTTFALYGVK